jgi:hypothetical protein
MDIAESIQRVRVLGNRNNVVLIYKLCSFNRVTWDISRMSINMTSRPCCTLITMDASQHLDSLWRQVYESRPRVHPYQHHSLLCSSWLRNIIVFVSEVLLKQHFRMKVWPKKGHTTRQIEYKTQHRMMCHYVHPKNHRSVFWASLPQR